VSDRTNTDGASVPVRTTRVRILRKAGEIARREATVAFPAAKRAASHAAQAFIKKFSEEYAKERSKR
jgi:hypothetical protein